MGENAGSKEDKARELGLTILDESGFRQLLETGSARGVAAPAGEVTASDGTDAASEGTDAASEGTDAASADDQA